VQVYSIAVSVYRQHDFASELILHIQVNQLTCDFDNEGIKQLQDTRSLILQPKLSCLLYRTALLS